MVPTSKEIPYHGVENTLKAQRTYSFWLASCAWKGIEGFIEGWTQENFIDECRFICQDNGNVGAAADSLLDDMIKGVERSPLTVLGELCDIRNYTPPKRSSTPTITNNHSTKTSIIGQAL